MINASEARVYRGEYHFRMLTTPYISRYRDDAQREPYAPYVYSNIGTSPPQKN